MPTVGQGIEDPTLPDRWLQNHDDRKSGSSFDLVTEFSSIESLLRSKSPSSPALKASYDPNIWAGACAPQRLSSLGISRRAMDASANTCAMSVEPASRQLPNFSCFHRVCGTPDRHWKGAHLFLVSRGPCAVSRQYLLGCQPGVKIRSYLANHA
jgi:hypothetical protein